MPAPATLPIARIDALFTDFDRPDAPGCAVGIVRDSELVYARGYGMANLEHGLPIAPASIFHVASISKHFTGLALVLLEQDGQLTLGDDVRRHLPELPDFGTTITLRHLLNHTSGLRDQWELLALSGWRPDDLVTDDDVLDLATRQRDLNFPVGSEYLYCNTGYTLAALVVRRVSGQSLRDFLHDRLFAPLGMNSTHFHNDHSEIVPGRTHAYEPRDGGGWRISLPVFDTTGATSLHTTVEDLARWVVRLEQWQAAGDPTLAALTTRGVLNDGTVLHYALGLQVGTYRGARTIEHSGGDAGYRAHFLWFPDDHFAAIVLGNRSDASPGQRARQIADLCLWGESLPSPPAIERDEAALATLAGIYRHPTTGEIRRLSVKDGRPTLDPGNLALIPLADDHFRYEGSLTDFQVATDADGRREFRITDERGTTTIYPAVPAAAPTPDQLAEYAGTYRSPELDVTYTLTLCDDRLSLQRRKFDDDALLPTIADGFAAEHYQLDCTRDAAGRVDGFTLTSGRVRRLRFDRIG
jgi:CubicO group peptidase (beta-lactamase class C family)